MADEFDPARRPYDILSAARKRGDSELARAAWAHAFGLSPDDRAGIRRGLALLAALADEVEQAVLAHSELDAKLLLEKLPSIRKAIGIMQLEVIGRRKVNC
jgi:hypothetical protein